MYFTKARNGAVEVCGIAGIVGGNRSSLRKMLEIMKHRGPDARGQVDIPEMDCTLGHVRLSIIDLDPRSNQPFISPCGRFLLTFNGEIYNYLKLRSKLELIGYKFRTRSDTEVLLYWLMEKGKEGLQYLEGMFAFCLVDRSSGKLLLARDQIGEKPLYYTIGRINSDLRFAFASEIKGLLVIPGIARSLDQEGLSDYLRFLYTTPPNTLYKDIKELPPGHSLEVEVNSLTVTCHKYYDLEEQLVTYSDVTYKQAVDIFYNSFSDSMRLRLKSDVPLSVYLSGGLDSNAILGAARELEPQLFPATFTIRYTGSSLALYGDESELAAKSAAYHGVSNHQIVFTEKAKFLESVERMVDLFDQPFGNSTAVVADKMAQAVSQVCKVALVGDGGDEVLVGYPRYKALPLHQYSQVAPSFLRNILAAGIGILPERGRMATKFRRLKQFARGLRKSLPEAFIEWSTYLDSDSLARATGTKTTTNFYNKLLDTFRRHQDNPVRAAALVDIQSFIPFNLMQAADRTSMAHSLEIRCPFLSPKVIQAILNIPTKYKLSYGRNKPLLVDAYSSSIPRFITVQPKRSFNPPIQGLVRRNLSILNDYLLGPGSQLASIVDRDFVLKELNDFRVGSCDNSTFLWGLATLECWFRRKTS